MRLRMCVSGYVLNDIALPSDAQFEFNTPFNGWVTIHHEPSGQVWWLQSSYVLGVFPDDLNADPANPNAAAAAESTDVRRE